MNEKARSALLSRVLEALKTAEVGEGKINAWQSGFDGVRQQVLKCRGNWLGDYDVNDIVSHLINARLPKDASKQSVPISNYLSDAALSEAADQIVTLIESVPRGNSAKLSRLWPVMATLSSRRQSCEVER